MINYLATLAACTLLVYCVCSKMVVVTVEKDMTSSKNIADGHVLPRSYGGGPFGLGDPNDRTLRKVEIDVMIPKKMNELAKKYKCADEVKEFETCCKSAGLPMLFKCRKENSALKSCLTHWYNDGEFKKHCTEVYLSERSEYRRTGQSSAKKK